MIRERATTVRCAIAALMLIAASVAALMPSRDDDRRVAVYRTVPSSQIVADSRRAFQLSARQS